MPGSGPVDLNEEPDINANPPIDPPTSQGFEEMFSLFNPFPFEWVLRALIDFTLSNARRFHSSMGNLLDGKGLRHISKLGWSIGTKSSKINKEADAQKDHNKVTQLEQTKSLLDKRQKPIKLAHSSEASWDAAQGYECQDIASDYENDKKIRNARAATNRKRKQKERERQQQTSKKRCTTPSRGTADHHLSSGICIATAFAVRSFCYSLRCFVFFSCYIGSSWVTNQIWLWLLCWASFYNGLENIFHVKWNKYYMKGVMIHFLPSYSSCS